MSDDFILKWDSATQQLVGEDPDGNPVAIPLSAVEIDDSATVDGETVAIDGDPQPPETHDNSAHSVSYAAQSDVDANSTDISNLQSNKLDKSSVTSEAVTDGYELTIDGDTYTFIEED